MSASNEYDANMFFGKLYLEIIEKAHVKRKVCTDLKISYEGVMVSIRHSPPKSLIIEVKFL